MPWNLDSSRPIYLQIIERVQMDIITGRYQPGDKLPSVRDLAQEAAVNPNTMKQLGITPEEIRQLLAETIEEEKNHE